MKNSATHRLLLIGAIIAGANAFGDNALHDPTQPPQRAAEKQAPTLPRALSLEGILRSADRYTAIVDGKVVRVGDRIGNAEILEITSDSVRYSQGSREHTIRLARRSIKVRREPAGTLGMNHE